jgi:hypothetical protein
MAMSELHQQIRQALLSIQLNGPVDHRLGICGNVTQIMGDNSDLDDAIDAVLTELFSDWPDKSHSTGYPVGNWSLNPSKVFWFFHDNRLSMWERKTRYGAARWALLEHCLNKLNQGES